MSCTACPLQVLLKLLEVFSSFDWDHYSYSLQMEE